MADLFAAFVRMVEQGTVQSFDGWVLTEGVVASGLVISPRRFAEEFAERANLLNDVGTASFSETGIGQDLPPDTEYEAIYMLDVTLMPLAGAPFRSHTAAFNKRSIAAWGFGQFSGR